MIDSMEMVADASLLRQIPLRTESETERKEKRVSGKTAELIRWYEGTTDREELVELIGKMKKGGEITSQEKNILCGIVFETIALHHCEQLLTGESGEGYIFHRELGSFLQRTLDDASMKRISFYEEEKETVWETDSRILANPDGVLVKMITGEDGAETAVVGAYLEVKFSGFANRTQETRVKFFLPETIRQMARDWKKITEGLDVADILPEKIDTVPRPVLVLVVPSDKRMNHHGKKIVVPVTTDSVRDLVEKIIEKTKVPTTSAGKS